MRTLKENLTELNLNEQKACYVEKRCRSFRFNFVGFEFLVMRRKFLRSGPLFSHGGNLNAFKSASSDFGVILRPQTSKFAEIKRKVKEILKLILKYPRERLHKVFELLNATVAR